MKQKKKVITLIIFLIAVVAIGVFFINLGIKKDGKILNAQTLKSMTYNEVTDEKVNSTDGNVCDFVEFSTFFTQDLNNDGNAEKVDGACREVSDSAQLYFRLSVLSKGYLKDGKININGQNFRLDTAIVADDVISKNYIDSDTKEINFVPKVENGTQKLIEAKVKSKIKNINDYSRNDNTVVFSGIFVYENEDGNEVEIPLNKTCNLTMDWYGTSTSKITTKDILNYSNENIVNKTTGNVDLSFEIETEETQYYLQKLLLDSNVVTVKLPKVKGLSALKASAEGEDIISNFDKDSQVLTLTRKADVDSEGNIVKSLSNSNTYKINVSYPKEIYNESARESVVLTIPVQSYYTAYNNPGEEFKNEIAVNITKSNVAEKSFAITYEKPLGDVYEFDTEIGEYVAYPYDRYEVSKRNVIKAYNNIELEEKDTYDVRWIFRRGSSGTINKTVMNYTKSDELNNKKSLDDCTTNIGIYIENAKAMLGENGYIKVYDNDKTGEDALIASFTAETWDKYSKESPFYYKDSVKNIRIETSESAQNTTLIIHNVKEINDKVLASKQSKEEFDKLNLMYTNLTGRVYNENSDEIGAENRTEVAYYEDEESRAYVSIGKTKIPTTEETKDVAIIVRTVSENYNESKWKNGEFLIEMPEGITLMEISSIATNNDNVKIKGYNIFENNGKYFIKVLTENSSPCVYSINIYCNITPNSKMATATKEIRLYAYNAYYENYETKIVDKYDVNSNGNVEESVGTDSCEVQFIAPTGLLTYQTTTNYDDEVDNEITIAPKIAEVKSSQRSAQINLNFINNYSNTISDTKILGKLPFEGNTYVITQGSLGSEFTTLLKNKIVLDSAKSINGDFSVEKLAELKNNIKIYYSTNEKVTNDFTNSGNNWVEESKVTNWTDIKSYYIDLGEFVMSKGDEITFKYDISIPEGISYEKVAYSAHAVYFNLDTPDGKLADYTEPNKLGFRITRKYNLTLEKDKIGTNKTVKNALYLLESGEANSDDYDSYMELTNSNGQLVFEELHVGKTYKLSEIKSEDNYELSSGALEFKVVENDTTKALEMQVLQNGAGYKNNSINNDNVFVKVEDRSRYNVVLTKYRSLKDTKIEGITYNIHGIFDNEEKNIIRRTNASGELKLDNIYLDKIYTIKELYSVDGYDLSDGELQFKATQNSQNGEISLEVLNNGAGYKNYSINQENETVNFNVEDDIKYSLNLNKKDTQNNNLAGVKYQVTGSNLDETKLTNSDGILELTGLKLNEHYTVKELYAKGYYLNESFDICVTKDENGDLQTNIGRIEDNKDGVTLFVEVSDEKIPTYDLELIKVEKNNRDKKLSGVQFLIEGEDFSQRAETDSEGKISLSGLYQYVEGKNIDGIYTITEEIPADGYVLESTPMKIQVSNNNGLQVNVLEGQNMLDKGDDAITVDNNKISMILTNSPVFKINKIDSNTKLPIANTKFAIYKITYNEDGTSKKEPAKDALGNIIGTEENINGTNYYAVTTNENGEITAGLPEGLYCIEEIQPAEGYEIQENNKTYTFRIGDTKPKGESYKIAKKVDWKEKSYFKDIKEVSDGYIVVGFAYDELNITDINGKNINIPAEDSFILKYDKNFENVIWANTVEMFASNVYIDKNNDCIVKASQYIIKYNKYGKLIKSINLVQEFLGIDITIEEDMMEDNYIYMIIGELGEVENESIKSISTENGDRIVTTGKFILELNDDLEIYDYTNINNSEYTNKLKKYNRSGVKSINYSNVGWFDSETEVTTQQQGNVKLKNSSIFVCDENVNYIWATSLNSKSIELINSAKLPDGGAIAFGNEHMDETIEINGKNQDLTIGTVVMKFDKNGNLVYALNSTDNELNTENSIIDSYGRYIVFGGSRVNETESGKVLLYAGIRVVSNENIDAEIPEKSEITIENTKKQYKITTEVKQGKGTISGQDSNPYETVEYKKDSKLPIIAVPESGWKVKRITINNQIVEFATSDDGSVTLPQFTEMTEDKHIAVWFVNPTVEYNYEVTKTDENGNPLSGAKFTVKKIIKDKDSNETLYDAKDVNGNLVGYEDTINNKKVRVVESDENGLIRLNLEYGNYRITEVKAPYGYDIPEENKYDACVGVREISYIEDLVEFSNDVNLGNGYSAELTRTLDFEDDNSYKDKNSTQFGDYNQDGNIEGIKAELTNKNGIGFISIGEGNNFTGNFEGNGYEIKNIYQNKYAGLFGKISDAKVANLGLNGGEIHSEEQVYAGALIRSSNSSIIYNCYNSVNIIANKTTCVGGISGYVEDNTKIYNCYNNGNITGKDCVGGIVGRVFINGVITNCYNAGKVIALSEHAAGIVGSGGMGDSAVNRCYNIGEISGHSYIGGIVGYGDCPVIGCYNTGNILGKEKVVAGIAAYGSNGPVIGCYNTGNISGKNYVGGIIGSAYISCVIRQCYNTGDITGTTGVGGICGDAIRYVRYCYNIGKLNCTNGGNIVGTTLGDNVDGILNDFYQSGSSFPGVCDVSDQVSGVIPKSEEYMKSQDFVDLLQAGVDQEDIIANWVHVEDEYPTLEFVNNETPDETPDEIVNEVVRIQIKNPYKYYKITTEVLENSEGSRSVGTISGENTENENIKFVESVKHGENSTINIEMKPFSNYKVDKIIINNEEYNDFTENEYGNVILDTFKNVVEDIHIQVIFERKSPFVLTKKNEEGDILPGAKFTISKITSEDDNTIEEPAKDIDGNILGSLENINGNELYVIESDENGQVVANLPIGKYIIKEVQSPDGYYYEAWSKTFEIKNADITEAWKSDKVYTPFGHSSNKVTSDGGHMNIRRYDIISKYNSKNELEWETTLTKSGYVDIYDIEEVSNGVYYAVGYIGGYLTISKDVLENSEEDFTIEALNTNTACPIMIKLNKNGKVTNVERIGDYQKSGRIIWIKTLKDGSYIINGTFGDNVEFSEDDTESQEKISVTGDAIIHYNKNGKVIRAIQLSGNNLQSYEILSVELDEDKYIFSVKTFGSGTIGFTPYIVDVDGNVTDVNLDIPSDMNNTYMRQVEKKENGNYIVVSFLFKSSPYTISGEYTADGKDIVIENKYAEDTSESTIFVLECNQDGKIVRAVGFDGGSSTIHGIKLLDNDDIIISGRGKKIKIDESTGENGYTYSDESDEEKGIIIQLNKDFYVKNITTTDEKENYIVNAKGNTILIGGKRAYRIATNRAPVDIELTNKKAGNIIVHHYLKNTDGTYTTIPVAPDETQSKPVGEQYTTSPKTDLTDVTLEKDENNEYVIPQNATGEFKAETQEITYYYEPKDITLTVHHYLEGTSTSLKDDEKYSYAPIVSIDNQNNTYKITANAEFDIDQNKNYNDLINNYNFVNVVTDIKEGATIDETLHFDKNSEVTYYYNTKGHTITTQVKKHTENRTDSLTNEKVEVQVEGGTITGDYNEKYPEQNSIKYIETVKQNENSTQTIIAKPDENYTVKQIKLQSTNDSGIKTETIMYGKDAVDNAEINATKDDNGNVTLTTFTNVTENKHIIVEFEPAMGTVIVHHYIEGTGEEYGNTAVKVPSKDGKVVENEVKNDYVGEVYSTKESNNVANVYELKSVSGKTSGKYTNDEINIYYYYNYRSYNYSIHYYYDGVEKVSNAITDQKATYGTIITDYPDKAEGYVFEKVTPAGDGNKTKLTITENEEQNRINVYYRSQFKITTDVIEHSEVYKNGDKKESVKGGEISGEDEAPYEKVFKGDIQQKEIKITPSRTTDDQGNTVEYEVVKIVIKNSKDDTTGVEVDITKLSKEDDGSVILPKEYLTDGNNGMQGDKHIEVEFRKKSNVIIKYLEKGTENVLYKTSDGKDYEEITGYEGEHFETSRKAITNYKTAESNSITDDIKEAMNKYNGVETNDKSYVNGTMYADTLTIIYWYEKISSGIIVKHIEIDESDIKDGLTLNKGKFLDEETVPGYVGELTNTVRKNYENMISVNGPESTNENLIIVGKDENNKNVTCKQNNVVEVRYYYEKQYNVTTEVRPHDEKIFNDQTNEYETKKVDGGTISKEYITSEDGSKVETIYEKINKMGYNKKKIEIIPDDGYRIKEITINGIKYDINQLQKDGDKVIITSGTDDNDEKAFFKDVNEDKHVIVEFERIPARVIVEYKDAYTKENIDKIDTKIINGYVNDKYNETRPDIEGYVSVDPEPTNSSGKMTKEDITIVYWYNKEYKITTDVIEMKLVDKEGNIITKKGGTISGEDEMPYETVLRGNNNKKAIEIIPDYGFEIKQIKINGVSIDYINDNGMIKDGKNVRIPDEYFKNMQENKHIEVEFKRIPGKIIVKNLEDGTDKPLTEDTTGSGYIGEKYKTQPSDIKYYELVEEKYPNNSEGELSEEETVVIYYYRKIKFNFKIEKEISKIVVNNKEQALESEMPIITLEYKDVSDTTIKVEYKIKVTNTEKLAGKAIIEENIPDGFEFAEENADEWNLVDGKCVLETELINPGEYKEYVVVLKWKNDTQNKGEKINNVKITDTQNEANFDETTLEDNEDNAVVELKIDKTVNDVIDDIKNGNSQEIIKDIKTTVKTGDAIIVSIVILTVSTISLIIIVKRKSKKE